LFSLLYKNNYFIIFKEKKNGASPAIPLLGTLRILKELIKMSLTNFPLEISLNRILRLEAEGKEFATF